jgi:streptogramin lyase
MQVCFSKSKFFIFSILFFCSFNFQILNAQIVGTLVGLNYLGNGKPATQAVLKQPLGVALDKQGNIYFADQANNLIRKINVKKGTIDNYAGDGKQGIAGDGGLANKALLASPRVFRFDTADNGYILDGNFTIRKVSKLTGIITTIVGSGLTSDTNTKEGPALNATFASPNDFTIDKHGNIYIVDRGTHTIRKVTISTGLISVIAGNGKAGYAGDGGLAINSQLNRPTCVQVDDSSNLYIADASNFRIRKISAKDGIITTIAGDGTSGQLANDTTLASFAKISNINALHVDKKGNIYFDMQGVVIKKIEKSSGLMYTIIGGPAGTTFSGDDGPALSAGINNPRSITSDSAGNIYIADYGNNRIRKVDASSAIINTIAGFGNFGGDNGNAAAALLNNPQGISVDKDGSVYIADRSNNRIRKVNASDGIITTLVGTSGNTSYSMAGNSSSVPNTDFGLINPINAVVDTVTGNLFIRNSPEILKLTKTNNRITWYAGGFGSNSFNENVAATTANILSNSDISIDKQGNIYTIETSLHSIRKITASTGRINTVVNSSRTAGLSGDGGAAISAKIRNPYCAEFDNIGNMYIGDVGNSCIRKVNALTGIITTIAGTGVPGFSGDNGLATQAQIFFPYSIAVDNFNNVIFVDGTRIRKINATTGIITTIAGTNVGGPFVNNVQALEAKIQPRNLVIDKSGNIYFTEPNNNAVRVIYNTPNVNISVENDRNFENFAACVGFASKPQSFLVNGNALIDSIRITSSADFEIATEENGKYSKYIALASTNSNVSLTKLYARLIAKPTLGNNYSGKITITSKNSNGRSLVGSGSVVSIPAAPSITSTGSNRICSGQSTILKTNSTDLNQWYFNNQPINEATDTSYLASSSGDYTVARNINGCESAQSSKTNIIVDNYPIAPTVKDTAYCLGAVADSLKANALSNNSLLWYGNNQTGGSSSTSSLKPVTSSIGVSYYYVSQKTNLSGCEGPRSKITITIKPIPTAPLLSRDTINNLISNNTIGLSWYKDGVPLPDTTQKIKPDDKPGVYTVKTTQNGCASALSNPYYFIVTDVININSSEFIKLAPNPFINQLNFDFIVKGYQKLNIEVFDVATGMKKASMQNLTPGMPIYLGQLSGGAYIINVSSNDGKINYQFKMVKL